MVGRSNAIIGSGSSWSWYAYIQVSTDANASITATNPAGNTYTKTANSSGAVTFTVAYPGTYTISETGATSVTVVVADYGVAYQASIYAIVFDGRIITDGTPNVSMVAVGAVGKTYTSKVPNVSTQQINVGGTYYNTKFVSVSNGSGMYITEENYDLSSYTKMCINFQLYNTACSLCIDDDNHSSDKPYAYYGLSGMSYHNDSWNCRTFLIDARKKVGVLVQSSGTAGLYIKDLWLE